MKQISLFSSVLLLASMLLISCQESSNIPNPGDNRFNLTSEPAPIVDAIDVSIDSALKIIDGLANDEKTTQKYRIRGVISNNKTYPFDVPSKYTDINFEFKDGSADKALTCYYTKNLKNKNFTSVYQVPLVGSDVTVVGVLTNYKGTTPELVDGFIESCNDLIATCNINDLPDCPAPSADQISIYQADSIGKALGSGKTSTQTYKIVGIVHAVFEAPSSYKNATFTISDKASKSHFYCYRVKAKNTTAIFSNPDMLVVGDTVYIESKITNYQGTVETEGNKGYIYWSSNKNLGFDPYEE